MVEDIILFFTCKFLLSNIIVMGKKFFLMSDDDMVLLQEVEVPKIKEFRYLGSTVQCNGDCGSEVKRRVQAGWNN